MLPERTWCLLCFKIKKITDPTGMICSLIKEDVPCISQLFVVSSRGSIWTSSFFKCYLTTFFKITCGKALTIKDSQALKWGWYMELSWVSELTSKIWGRWQTFPNNSTHFSLLKDVVIQCPSSLKEKIHRFQRHCKPACLAELSNASGDPVIGGHEAD